MDKGAAGYMYVSPLAWMRRGTTGTRSTVISASSRARKDMVSAGGAYRDAIAADPNCPVAHFFLGGLLLDGHKDVASAESAYRDAIAADPTFADAHNNLGYLLQHERKDVAGAGGACRDAIAADPKLVEAHNNLEYLLNNMKNFN